MSSLPCLAKTSFLRTTYLRKLCTPLTSCCISRKTISSDRKDDKSTEDYELAYTFPYIQVAAAVNRLKLYQTFVSSVAIPSSLACQAAGVVSMDVALPIAAISLTAAAALFAAGSLCSNLVGRVWVSRGNSQTQVRLSLLGFWGGRLELRLPAHDLLPLAELQAPPLAPFVLLRRYSTPDGPRPKLCLRFGQVVNQEAFRKALGHAPF